MSLSGIPGGEVATGVGHSLPMLLLRLREVVLLPLRPAIRPFDLTEQQARVLLVLHEAGALETRVLAEACCLQPPSLSRIVPRLRERGLISQHKPPADLRRLVVALTPEGLRVEQALRRALRMAHAEAQGRIGASQMRRIRAGLEAAIAVLGDPDVTGQDHPVPAGVAGGGAGVGGRVGSGMDAGGGSGLDASMDPSPDVGVDASVDVDLGPGVDAGGADGGPGGPPGAWAGPWAVAGAERGAGGEGERLAETVRRLREAGARVAGQARLLGEMERGDGPGAAPWREVLRTVREGLEVVRRLGEDLDVIHGRAGPRPAGGRTASVAGEP